MAKRKTLAHITIDRVYLALDDLLSTRTAALQSFPYGKYVEKNLTDLRLKIRALPEAARRRPLADALSQTDKTHDAFGGAIWHLIEAHLLAPNTPKATRDAAQSIREAFGSLDDLTASYDAEVMATKTRKRKMADLESALSLFPVAPSVTLLDWAHSFIAAGETIDSLLSKRADAKDRALAGRLRNDAVGLLNQTRKELARDKKKDPSLAEDLEHQVFAYFDQLEAKSAQEAAEEKKKEEEEETPKKTPNKVPSPAPSASPASSASPAPPEDDTPEATGTD